MLYSTRIQLRSSATSLKINVQIRMAHICRKKRQEFIPVVFITTRTLTYFKISYGLAQL